MNLDRMSSRPHSASRLAALLALLLIAGCGDQVVVEGVDLNNGTLAGDSVLDTDIEDEGMPGEEGYAPGNPYQEDIEGEANLGPNAPGYIPESIN